MEEIGLMVKERKESGGVVSLRVGLPSSSCGLLSRNELPTVLNTLKGSYYMDGGSQTGFDYRLDFELRGAERFPYALDFEIQ